jgi:N-methylhydantoinase A/oxoprolinase/acetone carboxylase beta subunit
MGPDGVVREPSEADLEALAESVAASGARSVAVCLLHADRHPAHELLVGRALAERLGDAVHVSLSHETVGTFREYERAATTEVDAALSPLLSGYLGALVERSGSSGLPEPLIMQSSGGLSDIATVSGHAALAVMSGPAGGAAAAGLVSALAGEPDLLCFDMGGTSCDVCVVEGGAVRESGGSMVGGRPLALPMVDIDTVGAGGGSIAWRDPGGALRVGPRSAGAEPGPACYGKGGTLPTVTDAHLVLGRLGEDPTLASGIVLDVEAARSAVAALARELDIGVDACAAGILEVADSEMVRALRVMTVQRGLDPRDFTLLAFGGAGPLHATSIADELSVRRVLVPVTGGVFSALGLAAADRRHDEVRTVMVPGESLTTGTLEGMIGDADQVSWDMRYKGQSFELTVTDSSGDPARLRQLFEDEHENRYGYSDRGAAIELVTVRRRHLQPGPRIDLPPAALPPTRGPGVVDLGQSTLWIAEGWVASGGTAGVIRLERTS